jgi:hypothetical protein
MASKAVFGDEKRSVKARCVLDQLAMNALDSNGTNYSFSTALLLLAATFHEAEMFFVFLRIDPFLRRSLTFPQGKYALDFVNTVYFSTALPFCAQWIVRERSSAL